jgi:hypothetical protein
MQSGSILEQAKLGQLRIDNSIFQLSFTTTLFSGIKKDTRKKGKKNIY